jgi:hypothetical protein
MTQKSLIGKYIVNFGELDRRFGVIKEQVADHFYIIKFFCSACGEHLTETELYSLSQMTEQNAVSSLSNWLFFNTKKEFDDWKESHIEDTEKNKTKDATAANVLQLAPKQKHVH